jgi:UDP-glucose-4-epimerase GalE
VSALPDAPQGPVLVTGGAGYIGSHTVRMLEQRGVPVLAFDNLSTGHRAALDAELVVGDLADRAALDRVFVERRPRAVIHFAARCYVGESVEDPGRYYGENVVNTWNLLEAMRAHDCAEIVFSSSCAVYGVAERMPIEEDAPRAPINPYGRTKLMMEQMIEDYSAAYGLRGAALRYFNAAGASADGSLGEDHRPETHLIPLVLDAARGRREAIEIYGADYATPDGTCVRDYVHVEDLADAHLRALAQLQAGRDQLACNLGTGRGYSVREIVEAARRVTGCDIREKLAPRRAGDPPELVSGGSRARDLLGWEPERSEPDRLVGDAWRFLRRHPDGFPE